jgi:hypothetical protein
MQHEPDFTDHMTDYLGNRQRPSGIPEDLLDQVDAAALDGARSVDSAARAGRQAGALVEGSLVLSLVFNRLGERHGYPLTELQECIHLAATPIQPRHVYGAAPDKVFCGDCLAAFFADHGEAIQNYDASTDCDACGTESKAEDLHLGNLSNGLVTYVGVGICSDCIAIGP